ncbi:MULTISPECIES: hypothetical protein [unclassified Streptomyces]
MTSADPAAAAAAPASTLLREGEGLEGKDQGTVTSSGWWRGKV